MPTYRAYRLDGTNKIVGADWIQAEDDDDAVRQAEEQARATGGFFELWERSRLVAKKRSSKP